MAQPKVNNTNSERKPIEGVKINSVLLGYKRMIGEYEGKAFDTVNLYFAECYFDYGDPNRGVYAEGFMRGNSSQPLMEVVKIPVIDFIDVLGVDYDEFVAKFNTDYQFHPCNNFGMFNDYGRFQVSQIQVNPKSAYDFQTAAPEKTPGTAEVTDV